MMMKIMMTSPDKQKYTAVGDITHCLTNVLVQSTVHVRPDLLSN